MKVAKAERDTYVIGEIREMNIQSHSLQTRDKPTRAMMDIGYGFIGGTAAIQCQELIIRQHKGTDPREETLIDEARANGWYREDQSMKQGDVGKLLELHGIPTRHYTNANPWQLAAELENGHNVIIGIEPQIDWKQNPIFMDLEAADPIVVSNIDMSDPGHTRVVVIAPGINRAAVRYSIEQFITAWKDSNFFMVATREPPSLELNLPEMKYLNHEDIDIDSIAEMPWGDLLAVHDAVEENILSSRDPHRQEQLNDSAHEDEVTPHLIDPLPHEHHESLTRQFTGHSQESYSPLSHDLDDPFEAAQEDDLFDTNDDDFADDGGLDLG